MKRFISILGETARHWSAHNAARMGAALSYYAIFSILPLSILVIAMVGTIFGSDLAESSIVESISRLTGTDSGRYLESVIKSALTQELGILGTVLSLATILFGAISAITVLDRAFDELWDIRPPQSGPRRTPFWKRIRTLARTKFAAFSLIPLMGLLFLFSVAVSVFVSLYQESLARMTDFGTLIGFIEPIATFVLGTVFFALMYRILPEITLPWREVFIGALLTTVLFLIGRFVIGLYIGTFVRTSLFGAAGSLIALLIWLYYSAHVLFFGASFTYVYSRRIGYLSKK